MLEYSVSDTFSERLTCESDEGQTRVASREVDINSHNLIYMNLSLYLSLSIVSNVDSMKYYATAIYD